MEFIKRNARGIIILLLALGVIAALSASSSNEDTTNDTVTEESVDSSEDSSDTESATEGTSDNTEETTDETTMPESETEEEAQAEIQKADDQYSVVAVTGDNQTKLVRRIVDNYIQSSGTELSAEQKLFTVTKLVASLPMKDLIFVGEKVEVSEAQLKSLVDSSKQLTQDQVKAWAAYL